MGFVLWLKRLLSCCYPIYFGHFHITLVYVCVWLNLKRFTFQAFLTEVVEEPSKDPGDL